jgi:hypothetical protein
MRYPRTAVSPRPSSPAYPEFTSAPCIRFTRRTNNGTNSDTGKDANKETSKQPAHELAAESNQAFMPSGPAHALSSRSRAEAMGCSGICRAGSVRGLNEKRLARICS